MTREWRSATICILNDCFSQQIKDNGTQKAVQRQRMGILLCEQNFRDVWSRNESVGQTLVKFCTLHTLTHAAKLVVR